MEFAEVQEINIILFKLIVVKLRLKKNNFYMKKFNRR